MSRPNEDGYPASGEKPVEYLKRMRPTMAPGFSYDQRSLYRAIIDALLELHGETIEQPPSSDE